jgi:hypothetical protein
MAVKFLSSQHRKQLRRYQSIACLHVIHLYLTEWVTERVAKSSAKLRGRGNMPRELKPQQVMESTRPGWESNILSMFQSAALFVKRSSCMNLIVSVIGLALIQVSIAMHFVKPLPHVFRPF